MALIIKLLSVGFGVAFTTLIPGLLLTFILFRDMEWLERFAIGFGLSISITVFIGFALTFPNNNALTQLWGGIHAVLPALVLISAVFLGIIYGKKRFLD